MNNFINIKTFTVVALTTCISLFSAELSRFAVVVAANNGGQGRDLLRFAPRDASNFTEVLSRYGALEGKNYRMLIEPEPEMLKKAFADIGALTKSWSDNRREFIFYYSGHSDETGLLLGNKKLSWNELKKQLMEISADVRVAVLDSCSSGSFTRTKGGVKQPAFLTDKESESKGHVYLSSSSADEASQESDRLQGSFFTHSLVAGMRGAADYSGDKVVTLGEAYQYAYQETLNNTEKTKSGPQHPSWDIQLSGSGDLTLTDIRNLSSSLALNSGLSGRLVLRDDEETVIAEFRKNAGKPLSLGIEPGNYTIYLAENTESFAYNFSVSEGQQHVLTRENFSPLSGHIPGAVKGDNRPVTHRFLSVGFLPDLDFISANRIRIIKHFSVNVIGGASAEIQGMEISSLFNIAGRFAGLQSAGLLNISGPFKGGQAAGLFNIAGSKRMHVINDREVMTGGQAAGLFNICGAPIRGLQAAGLFSISGSMIGMQSSGLFNISTGKLHGLQAGGLLDIAGPVYGIQASGLASISITGSTIGVQASGLTSYAHTLTGMQASGLASAAGNVNGVQASGLANKAGDINGFQAAGLLNIARDVKGVQVGLVNVARDLQGVPIGLVNISKTGVFAQRWYINDLGEVNAGYISGGKNIYSGFSMTSDGKTAGPEFRYGFLKDLRGKDDSGIFLDGSLCAASPWMMKVNKSAGDIKGLSMNNGGANNQLYKLELGGGFRFFRHLGIFGGLTYSVLLEEKSKAPVLEKRWLEMSAGQSGYYRYRLFPGFRLGVQF